MFNNRIRSDLAKLINQLKPVSGLNNFSNAEKELLQSNLEKGAVIHIPTYSPDKYSDFFGDSEFYCLPGYEEWARVCYLASLLGDTALYNLKDKVFVIEQAVINENSIFEINPFAKKGSEIIEYSNASFPFYKDQIKLDDLVGTTFLAGRLLGYNDDLTYIPRVIISQYSRRPIFFNLYFHKYPRTTEEMKEEETMSVPDFRGRLMPNSSPTYVQRVSKIILAEQREAADWFMVNQLHAQPGPFSMQKKEVNTNADAEKTKSLNQ